MPEFVSSGDPEPAIAGMVSRLAGWLGNPVELGEVATDMRRLADRTAAAGASESAARFLLAQLDGLQVVRRAA
jgi:hypothetical protein